MRSQWRLVDVQLPSLMHLGAELFKACADESQRLVWRGWCSLRSQWRLGDVHQGEQLQREFVFVWVHVTAVFSSARRTGVEQVSLAPAVIGHSFCGETFFSGESPVFA
mmetsp:Transcript_141316/g.451372  ORF Transcript_141316/g.451372 Transcript_141316/m.451372 type:complete len:108 (+) Transcript_141316:210-533(+)